MNNIKWTFSRIDAANYCRMRYYLRYVEHEPPLNLSAYKKGILLHDLIQYFWKKLGTEEEVEKTKNKKGGKKYYDSETFSEYAKGKWASELEKFKKLKIKVEWRSEDEGWAIYNSLPKICTPLYETLIKEGRSLASELKFNFILRNIRFFGKIDEVRLRDGKVVVRDYKSGRPYIGEMKLNHDPQLTMYNVGLCSLCYSNREFASSLGIGEDRKRFMGNPIFVNPEFEMEFFMVNDCSIHKTTRRDEHFFEIIQMINGTQKAVDEGNIYPERGRKCDSCDMRKACESKLESAVIPLKGQTSFDFAIPSYVKPFEIVQAKSSKDKQRKFNFKRKTSY